MARRGTTIQRRSGRARRRRRRSRQAGPDRGSERPVVDGSTSCQGAVREVAVGLTSRRSPRRRRRPAAVGPPPIWSGRRHTSSCRRRASPRIGSRGGSHPVGRTAARTEYATRARRPVNTSGAEKVDEPDVVHAGDLTVGPSDPFHVGTWSAPMNASRREPRADGRTVGRRSVAVEPPAGSRRRIPVP
jgi:hypothetical protein